MQIKEILLSPGSRRDRDLLQRRKEIETLKKRIDGYVDRIYDPKTTTAGKDFLKTRIRDDYAELKNLVGEFHQIAENNIPAQEQYEVYDRQTGERVPGRGPYNSRSRARRAVDQLDNQYGGYRYGWRPIKRLNEIFEPKTNWRWVYKGPEEKVADFKVGNVSYRFVTYLTFDGYWKIEFSIIDPEYREKGQSHSVTGTGNSVEVFSTVIDIIRDLLNKDLTITKLLFAAEEPNRVKLYLRMAKRLLPEFDVYFDGKNTIEIIHKNEIIKESVNRIPITDRDFLALREVFEKPIPASLADIFILEFIDDDELSAEFHILGEQEPDRDVRPLVAEWVKRVMPDQLHRLTGESKKIPNRLGNQSVIAGENLGQCRGTDQPFTGNAYGRR